MTLYTQLFPWSTIHFTASRWGTMKFSWWKQIFCICVQRFISFISEQSVLLLIKDKIWVVVINDCKSMSVWEWEKTGSSISNWSKAAVLNTCGLAAEPTVCMGNSRERNRKMIFRLCCLKASNNGAYCLRSMICFSENTAILRSTQSDVTSTAWSFRSLHWIVHSATSTSMEPRQVRKWT